MIHCNVEVREGVFVEEEAEDTFIEELEAILGSVFQVELSNVEVFWCEFEPSGPIDVNDTDMWLVLDVDSDLFTSELFARRAVLNARRSQLRDEILSLQETHTLNFKFRSWVRLMEGSYDQA